MMTNNYVNKYKNLPLGVKAGLWFAIYGFLQKGISIITVPVFTRIMSPEQYGVFSIFTAWSGILVIMASFNLHQGAINNAFIKYENQKEKVVSSFQGLSTVLSVLFMGVYILLQTKIDRFIGLPSYLIFIMFISFIFRPSLNYWTIIKRYKNEYKLPVLLSMIIAIITPIISYVFIINTENKGEVKVLVTLVITIITGLFFFVFNFYKNRTFYDKELWKLALFINLPLVPHYLSEIALNQSDRIMIDKLIGTGEAGIYSLAYAAASIITVITASINFTFVPWQYKRLKKESYEELDKISNFVLVFIASILIFIISLAPEIVRVLAPNAYHEAIYIIPPVATGVFFNYMYQLFARVEIYFSKTNLMMIGSIISSFVNIILNLIFIPIYGYIAAGYTTLLCYLLLNLIHYCYYKKICIKIIGINSIYSVKKLLRIAFSVILISFLMLFLYDHFFIRYIIIFIILIMLIYKRETIFDQIKMLFGRTT